MNNRMMLDNNVYTDIQGLDKLKYAAKNHSDEAKKAVAQQFEAIMMQMVLKSMRDANKVFASDMFGSESMDMYQDMYDKQLSLNMSNAHLGFAEMIMNNMDRQIPPPHSFGADVKPTNAVTTSPAVVTPAIATTDVTPSQPAPTKTETFTSPEDFVKSLWPSAKVAANFIGASPEILLAQAALETNWGKNILSASNKNSTHNLFNIKAGAEWNNPSIAVGSLEQRNGILVKEKSNFRSYHSYHESFLDYVNVLKQNGRYSEALNKATDPKQFVHALQSAGYATDENYADKIMKIFTSPSFQTIVKKLKGST